ncbi:MAG: outer membrane beta-barrel protein [Betaproteobacteria bacterium]|nr:outer membrane beta-barrel protein [Betaproteobacteria bacterium]
MKKAIASLTSLFVVSTLLCTSAQASDSGFTISVAGGVSKYKDIPISDDRAESGNVAVGYRFNKVLGIELGYTDFGTVEDNSFGSSIKAKLTATQFSLISNFPIDGALSGYARVGVQSALAEVRVPNSRRTARRSQGIAGLGLGYSFTNLLEGTLEYQYTPDVSTVNVGLRIKF